MMKKFFVMMSVLCAMGAIAAETVAFAPALKQQKEIGGWSIASITKTCKVADGKAIFSVTEKKAAKYGNGDFQAWIPFFNATLQAGKKYTLSFTIKSNKDFTVDVNAMLFGKPYTGFGWKRLNLKANQAQNVSLDFSVKQDVKNNFRMPGLSLGTAPVGTSVEVSNIKLIVR